MSRQKHAITPLWNGFSDRQFDIQAHIHRYRKIRKAEISRACNGLTPPTYLLLDTLSTRQRSGMVRGSHEAREAVQTDFLAPVRVLFETGIEVRIEPTPTACETGSSTTITRLFSLKAKSFSPTP